MVELGDDAARRAAGIEGQQIVRQRAAHEQVGLAAVERVGLHQEDVNMGDGGEGDAAAVLVGDGYGDGIRAGLLEDVVEPHGA